jgi:hypothetical protein
MRSRPNRSLATGCVATLIVVAFTLASGLAEVAQADTHQAKPLVRAEADTFPQ